jgi:hypothetical protein
MMMMLNPIVTQMEAVVGNWQLRLARRRQATEGPVVTWSVLRWPANRPQIPPLSQLLTQAGWQPALNVTEPLLYVTEQRLEQIVAESCVS